MKHKFFIASGLLAIPCFLFASDLTEFDDEILKERGIDTSVAKKLAGAPSFIPGFQNIKVYVNDIYKNDISLDIKETGELCLTKENLETVGIIRPFSIKNVNNECVSLKSEWPDSEIIKKPNQQSVWIIVPEKAIDSSGTNGNYLYGGHAGILNYTAQAMGGGSSSSDDMYFVNSELGLNANNWIFRSAQIFTHSKKSELHHQYAYSQTTIERLQKNIQIGQINLNNSVVGGSRVLGLQLSPETLLSKRKESNNVVVSGVASEASMVEVYQSGRLIYNTAVPAGAFQFTNISPLNYVTDLRVYVKGVDGSEHNFIVPASTFSNFHFVDDTDYTFGLGRFDEQNAKKNPLVASISKGWGISPETGLQFGTLFTQNYHSFGVSISNLLSNHVSVNTGVSLSHDDNNNKTGDLITSSINFTLLDSLSVGGSFLLQSKDYSYLNDSVGNYYDFDNKQKQYGIDLSWSGSNIGSLNTSLGRSYTYENKHLDYISFTWSKSIFGRYNLSSTIQRNYTVDNQAEDNISLRLSIPLDRASLSSWLNHSNDNNRVGVRYNNYVNHDRNWGLSYEHNDTTHYQSLTGNISTLTPYAQIGGNIQHTNENKNYWGGFLSGGGVWVKEGVLLSPYDIKETFGVAKAGDRRFVKIESNSGPTWTNGEGYAVLPSLIPYSTNAIRLDTKTLSRHSDIQNAYKSVMPAKGSVTETEFLITNTRRVLLNVNLDEELLPENSVISDSEGRFLTLATKNGEVFISDGHPNIVLNVETPDYRTCKIKLHLSEHAQHDVLFEKVSEQCFNIKVN